MKSIQVLITIATVIAVSNASPLQVIEMISNGSGINYQMLLLLPKGDNQQQGTCEDPRQVGTFTIYDYAVVIGMLVISLGIGVFYGFFDKKLTSSAKDFMLGSEMTIFPVTLSLTTSFITAIELLGNPAEMFFQGTQFSLIVVSMMIVIPFALKTFYPIYDNMKLTSCYEYLGMRFGKEMRIFGGILYIVQMCFYTSVSVLAPAIALSKATGLNTRLAIVLIYVVCVFYSSQGGLKAVVIADTFQACVLVVSLLLILVIGTYLQDGGIAEIFNIAKANDRLEMLNFDPNPTTRHTVFSVVIGGFFYWASLLCVNQSTVQKAMSLRSLSKARVALALSIVGLCTVFIMNFYTGLMTFAKYSTCDPLKSGKIDAIDQLVPFYVMETFGHFTSFVGIFVAGIFAASLGTVAACLSSLSAVTIEDLLICGINIKFTPEKSTHYAKWMNFGYGVISFGLIFLVEGRSILQATLTLNGLVGGILLGLFSLGIFFKKANTKGALYGGLLSTLCVLTLGIFALTCGAEQPYLETSTAECSCMQNSTTTTIATPALSSKDNESSPWYMSIHKVSYMWYSMIGTLMTVGFGLLISILTQYYEDRQISKISAKEHVENIGKFSPIARDSIRKISTMVHTVSNEVSESATKIEHKLWGVMGHHTNDGDQNNIINENDETIQVGESTQNGASVIGYFKSTSGGIDNQAMNISDENPTRI